MKKFAWFVSIVFAMALAACDSTPPTPVGSFSLGLDPSSLKLGPASQVKAVVRITRNNGFAEPVQLSLENLPADVQAVFDPNPATTDTSTLKLSTSKTSSAQTLSLSLLGTAGVLQAKTGSTLEITTAFPAPTVTLEPTLQPSRPALLGIAGGAPRPLATAMDGKGKRFDFVEDEVIVVTDDQIALNAFLARYNGTVLRSHTSSIKGLKPVYHIKLNLDAEDSTQTAARLAQLEPGKTGSVKISSLKAQRLIGVFAQERANGLNVALNFTLKPHTFNDGVARESNEGEENSMLWSYFKRGGNLDIDVASAWQALERAGKLENKIRIGIVDEGFSRYNYSYLDNFDMPEVKATRGIMLCDGDCKNFHGHKVTLAAAGIADNGFGAAGPAGPVAELVFSGSNFNDTEVSEAYDLLSDVPDAAEMGAKIINMSFGAAVPALFSAVVIPIEDMTQTLRASGVLLFASAGNDGEDVDAEDCFVACWEEEWHTPCENDGVICVGGMEQNQQARDPNSNYGFEDVNIWSPYTVVIGPSPDNPDVKRQSVSGTSFSSPFVAGVAALVWAANPNQSATQVWNKIISNSQFFGNAPYLRWQVKAFKAVSAVLGNTAPSITITAPLNGAGEVADTTNRVTFNAAVSDLEDSNCCTVKWTSTLDGDMGTGNPLEFNFAGKQGNRTITATIKDSKGVVAEDSVVYKIRNVSPEAEIEIPSNNHTYYKNQSFLLRGKGTDYTPYPTSLPCSSLTWQVTKPSGAIITFTGCERTVAYDLVGQLKIKLIATDSNADTGSDEITVNIIERPVGAFIDISSPPTGTLIKDDSAVQILEQHNAGSAKILEYRWVFSAPSLNRSVNVIRKPGDGIFLWTPRFNFPVANCGAKILLSIGVTMITDQGTTSDAVLVKIYGDCVPN